jgi:hypothetical protein
MTLTRTRHKMPDYIRNALNERKLVDAYHARPDYQQNDYIGSLCVIRAKHDETKQKRLAQMLDELEGGNLYMNMSWTKSHTRQPRSKSTKTAK